MVVNAKPDLDPKSVLDAEDWYQTREISDAEYRELIAQGRVPPRLDDPEKALEDLAIYGNFLYDSGLEAPGLLTTGIAIATGVGVADHPMRELTDDEKIHFLAAGATNVVAGMAWAVSVVGKPVIVGGAGSKPSGGNKVFENLHPQDIPRSANTIPLEDLKTMSNRNLAYVVLEDGTLVIGRNNLNQGHIDLANGKPVLAAGRLEIVGGKIRTIDNWSGHYKPSGTEAQIAAENAFRELGFNVDGKYIERDF